MKSAKKTTRWLTVLFTMFTILMLTQHAQAHIVAGDVAGGFLAGMKHPWSGWDHICAMVAVGLWGAQLGMPAIWILPVTFPVIMSIGGFLGLIGVKLPGGQKGDELGIALSAVLLGLMVLLKARPPLWAAMILVGFFGLCHGWAHGHEMPPDQSALLYSIGFVIATGTLHGVGITIGLLNDEWKDRAWAPILGTLLLGFMLGLGLADGMGVSGWNYWGHVAIGFALASAILMFVVVKAQLGEKVIRALGAAITLGGCCFLYQAFTAEEQPATKPTTVAIMPVRTPPLFDVNGI
jgi:urease accessory protein